MKLTGIKKSLTLSGKKIHVHVHPKGSINYNVLLRHPPLQLSEMQLDDIAEKKSITASNKNY